MDRLARIANPVVVLVLICVFMYVYFGYLRGGSLPFLPEPLARTETEKDWEEVPPKDPKVVALAGTVVQQQNQLDQQNMIQQPNQLDAQQGTPDIILPASPNPLDVPQGNPDTILPPQPNPNLPLQPIAVPDMALQEGHWIGLEVIPLTAGIAGANSIPPDVAGVLIDEVTLLSAEVGLYAGDVITAVNGKKVWDLKSFQVATTDVAQSNRADLSIYSRGKNKDIVVFSTEVLGVAQMEAAPMILATAKSPHGYYGPCDRCHAIARTALNPNQLLKDQGDSLTKVAPNIRKGTPPPHRDRGACTKCHVVV